MNHLFIIGIGIMLLIITILLIQFKKVKSSEAYVIERKGKFNRIVTSKYTFLIPFLDRVKCIVTLNSQMKKSYINPVTLADGYVINTNNTIEFHITDIYKAVYEIKNIEYTLGYLQITLFCDIIQNLDSTKVKYLNEDIRLELKSKLNEHVNIYGYQIDNVDIEILNDDITGNVKYVNKFLTKKTNSNETPPVIDYEKYKKIMDRDAIKLTVMIIIFLIIFCTYIFSIKHELSYILCELIVKDILKYLVYTVFFCLSYYCYRIFRRKKRLNIPPRNFFVISLLLIVIPNIVVVQRGIGTNLLNFEISIFKDIITDETKTSKVENIKTHNSGRYYTRIMGKRYEGYQPAYISYQIEGNTKYYESKSTNAIVNIIYNLKPLEKEIEIEYYNYSKIIKSINGIEITDGDKLKERINSLKKLEEKKEISEIELRTQKYIIRQNSIGKNIQEVKKELEAIDTSDISINYINSKYYPVGTVAFVERDGENFTLQTFYVVKSNDSEDLTQMPKLKKGMSKEELIQIFEQSELNYKFTIQKSDSSEKGLLLYTPPGAGTYIPKGSIVNVTILE